MLPLAPGRHWAIKHGGRGCSQPVCILPTPRRVPRGFPQLEDLGEWRQGFFFFFHLIAEVRWIISKQRQLSCVKECSASLPSLHNRENCFAEQGYSGGCSELLGLGSCPCSAGAVLQLLPHSCAQQGSHQPYASAWLHLQVEMLPQRAVICLNAPQLH